MKARKKFTAIVNGLRTNWLYGLLLILVIMFSAIYVNKSVILSASQPAPRINESEVAGAVQEPRKVKPKTVARVTKAKKPSVSVTKKPSTRVPAIPRNIERTQEPIKKVDPPKPIKVATMAISGMDEYAVELRDGENAFAMVQRVATDKGIYLSYEQYDFGKMITQIGSLKAEGTYYWALYYNGAYAQVGAEELIVGENDKLEWRYESWAN